MKTTVVHVREGFDIYIGRAVNRAGDKRCRVQSIYANPFKIGADRTREMALAEYDALWRQRLASNARHLWHKRLKKLRGKRLGCWCAPAPCHGDVLVRLLQEFGIEK